MGGLEATQFLYSYVISSIREISQIWFINPSAQDEQAAIDFAFARHCVLWQSLTFIVQLYFLRVVLSLLFIAWKVAKAPVTGKISHNSLLLTSRKRHPSVGCCLPQTAFRSSIGDKTTRFSRNNSNVHIHRSDKFCPIPAAWTAGCCDFDDAGFLWYYHCPCKSTQDRPVFTAVLL